MSVLARSLEPMKVVAYHSFADIVTTSLKQCYGVLNRTWSLLGCRTWLVLDNSYRTCRSALSYLLYDDPFSL